MALWSFLCCFYNGLLFGNIFYKPVVFTHLKDFGTLEKSKLLSVALGTPELHTCDIDITSFTGSSISVSFSGLPANQPKTYQNFVAVWEASVIPWTVEPLRKIDVGVNTQSGTVTIDNLTVTYNSYIVAYGVGSDIGNISASALLSAGGLKAAPTKVNLGIQNLGTTSLSIHYQTLSGYQPKANDNWIGLWEGYVSPYNLPPKPVHKQKVKSYANEGVIGFNNLDLARNTTYTLIYFMGDTNTTAAAMLNFTTQAPSSDD